MNGLILFVIGFASAISIVTVLNITKKGRESSKGITEEYISKDGTKHTAKKDREDHIV